MQACRGSKSQSNVFDEVRVESVVKFHFLCFSFCLFVLSFIYFVILFIYLFIYFILDSFLCFFW